MISIIFCSSTPISYVHGPSRLRRRPCDTILRRFNPVGGIDFERIHPATAPPFHPPVLLPLVFVTVRCVNVVKRNRVYKYCTESGEGGRGCIDRAKSSYKPSERLDAVGKDVGGREWRKFIYTYTREERKFMFQRVIERD